MSGCVQAAHVPLMAKQHGLFSVTRISLLAQLACNAVMIEILRARGVSTRAGYCVGCGGGEGTSCGTDWIVVC